MISCNLKCSVLIELVASLAEFAFYQSLDFKTISVEAFSFENDQYVVFAQPFNGKCSFLEWDHVEMVFRNYDEIESKSATFPKKSGGKFALSLFSDSNLCLWFLFPSKRGRSIQESDFASHVSDFERS